MEDGNVNIMVEAKKEYTAQLCNIMCPFMIETFELMYQEANNISKGKKVLLQYQRLLKEVPNWNNHMISEHNSKLNNNCSWFNDLLAAVFVSNVKILSSVRLKSQSKKISVKLPTNERFIHACYINAAKDLYKDPYVFNDNLNDYEKDEVLTKRFINVIMTTVQEMIPVQEILKTYISQVEQVDVESIADEYEEAEDPDIEEGEYEEAPPVSEPEPPVSEPAAETNLVPEPEQAEEEHKEIPITGKAASDEDVLFNDAPDETKPSV